MPELHGVLEAETRDWTDGLLPCIFRDLNKPLPPGKACAVLQARPAEEGVANFQCTKESTQACMQLAVCPSLPHACSCHRQLSS